MKIRRAEIKDSNGITALLYQVQKIHSDARPDIFRSGAKKYTHEELCKIISDDSRPIFVAADDCEKVLGYAFCIIEDIKDSTNLSDRRSLYIDDLCVDEKMRGKHVGTALYEHVLAFAKDIDCHHITLNVWSLNESAMKFYEKCGLSPLKLTMEKLL